MVPAVNPMGAANPHDKLLMVAKSGEQADAAATFLSTQGISTTIQNCPGGVIEFGRMLCDLELRVRTADLARARELLETNQIGWSPPPARRIGF